MMRTAIYHPAKYRSTQWLSLVFSYEL